MVRAGVVSHPSEWEMSGYNEIQNPPDRYGVIERLVLQQLCGFSNTAQFVEQHGRWVQEAIAEGSMQRENCWTESIAVGSMEFVEETKIKLGICPKGRRINEKAGGLCVLREEGVPYNADFAPKSEALSAGNGFFWDNYHVFSTK
jgi:putative transposase